MLLGPTAACAQFGLRFATELQNTGRLNSSHSMIDIIGDGELNAEALEQLHREGLWPLYESLRQTESWGR